LRELTPPQIHVSGSIPARVTQALEREFCLVDDPVGAEGLLSVITTTVDSTYLEKVGAQLKVVANYGAGVDNVDLDAARERGVVVTNTPDVLTKATAELAVTLMLSLLRRVTEGDRFIRRREPWSFSLEFMLGESLYDKLVAIIGPGRIGRETARLAQALGSDVTLVGRAQTLEAVERADIVSVHCPFTPETHHLIDDRVLARMRPTSVLVNTARGPIVDEVALVEALRAGVIAGAALDVFEFEPKVTEDLLSMENVVLTPHLGSGTRQTREAMGMLAVEALRAVLLEGRRPRNTVG
jgi:glyoxylate reductase